MLRMMMALAVLALTAIPAQAGRFHKKDQAEEVPGGHPKLIAPDGEVVPRGAARQMERSTGPLYGQSWGRRSWAMPASYRNSPASRMAMANQLGYGVGPTPGFTNDAPLGNYPTAAVGPGNPAPWMRPFRSSAFPFVTAITGR